MNHEKFVLIAAGYPLNLKLPKHKLKFHKILKICVSKLSLKENSLLKLKILKKAKKDPSVLLCS